MTAALEREAVSFAPLAAAPAPPDARAEPRIATIPGLIGSEGVARLDPARATSGEPERPVHSARRSLLPFALIGSIALHLLPAALFVDWRVAPAKVAAPIPVELVIVPPKPPPAPPRETKPPPPRETKRPAPGRLASEDVGSPKGQRHTTGADTAPRAAPREAPTELVSALPPPRVDPLALPQPA
ncbi:MAG TPA: hypothetical protein VMF86_04190, partial [Stellaceae bacterium]|nr:hypothetical protein [Stellaceae bacterium]